MSWGQDDHPWLKRSAVHGRTCWSVAEVAILREELDKGFQLDRAHRRLRFRTRSAVAIQACRMRTVPIYRRRASDEIVDDATGQA
jgi:hypothetical protein